MGETSVGLPPSQAEIMSTQKIAMPPAATVKENPFVRKMDEFKINFEKHGNNLLFIKNVFEGETVISEEKKEELRTDEGMKKILAELNEFKTYEEELEPLEYLRQSEYFYKALGEIKAIKKVCYAEGDCLEKGYKYWKARDNKEDYDYNYCVNKYICLSYEYLSKHSREESSIQSPSYYQERIESIKNARWDDKLMNYGLRFKTKEREIIQDLTNRANRDKQKLEALEEKDKLLRNLSKEEIILINKRTGAYKNEMEKEKMEIISSLITPFNKYGEFREYIVGEIFEPNGYSYNVDKFKPDCITNLPIIIDKFACLSQSGGGESLKYIKTEGFRQIVNKDLFSTIEKYNWFVGMKQNDIPNVMPVLYAIIEGKISKERANELPTNNEFIEILFDSQIQLASQFPQIFLETDTGLEFFDKFRSGGIFSVDKNNALDRKTGKLFRDINKKDNSFRDGFVINFSRQEISKVDELLSSDSVVTIGKENWKQLLFAYVRNFNENVCNRGISKLSERASEKIKGLFADQNVRDFCLSSMKNEWQDYLKSGNPDEMPFSLSFMSHFIKLAGGAGNLSQIQSLSELMCNIDETFTKKTTVEKTKNEIFKGFAQIENRFEKERWSNEDRINFYNMSKDILEASPSIFTDYLNLFDKLSPSQMEHFYKEIYPLYRTKIILMERRDSYDKKVKKEGMKKMFKLREEVRTLTESIGSTNTTELFVNKKTELIGGISNDFKERFGIIKIPDNFDSEQIKSINNITMYLSNLHDRTPEKEDVLAYYLSLMINNKWSDFRNGTVFDPKEFLTEEKSYKINNLLEKRTDLNVLTTENLGIKPEVVSEFTKLLQEETSNIVIGNVETIDIKLANIISNLRSLEDPDLYPEKIDKQRLNLLLQYGNKSIGSVAAKMYQELNNPNRKIEFTEDENNIKDQIVNILKENQIDLSTKSIKDNFQDGIKPLATVANLLNHVSENNTETEIDNLRKLLIPSQQIIEIFQRFNESFTPTSGAIAVSQDLTYLDNLINKNEDKLKPEEKDVLKLYTSSIRGKLIQLETIYTGIVKKFATLREGNSNKNNPQLIEKLEEINRIINTQATQQVVTSILTNDLNTIMENIRECLSCRNQGCNNDTDLSFGDSNKFFLYSQSETQKTGSIADEIVFIEPITREDGTKEISFILDKIYGTNTPTIVENHINTIIKKQKQLKQKFPEVKIGIFVSSAAIFGGSSPEMLINKLKENKIDATLETVEINVVESATGDHYVEFGGDARVSGIRQVQGIRLSL